MRFRYQRHSFPESFGWPKFWRIFALGPALLYFVFAYEAAYDGDRFSTLLFSMLTAMYLFGVGKAHSSVKKEKRRRDNR